jgi:predicted nucleic acid-binding protein
MDIGGILEANQVRMVTSHAVLLEIGNALSRKQYRHAAVALLTELHTDPMVEIVRLTPDLYDDSYQLFASRPDKEWGLTDCYSFEIMRRNNIVQALTADEHFVQAGFQALLRSEAT